MERNGRDVITYRLYAQRGPLSFVPIRLVVVVSACVFGIFGIAVATLGVPAFLDASRQLPVPPWSVADGAANLASGSKSDRTVPNLAVVGSLLRLIASGNPRAERVGQSRLQSKHFTGGISAGGGKRPLALQSKRERKLDTFSKQSAFSSTCGM
ncbi:hypothetical protein FHT71_004105 [Rhizobium sp. BK060]|nr:hypothetical protein [Rhizobium sp. BK060]